MTLATEHPPTFRSQPAVISSVTEVRRPQAQSKSIFASKTFWGIVFTTVAAIAPIIGENMDDMYEHHQERFPATAVAQIVVILCGAASAIIGRVDAGSVHTPGGLPGPNKSDFH